MQSDQKGNIFSYLLKRNNNIQQIEFVLQETSGVSKIKTPFKLLHAYGCECERNMYSNNGQECIKKPKDNKGNLGCQVLTILEYVKSNKQTKLCSYWYELSAPQETSTKCN